MQSQVKEPDNQIRENQQIIDRIINSTRPGKCYLQLLSNPLDLQQNKKIFQALPTLFCQSIYQQLLSLPLDSYNEQINILKTHFNWIEATTVLKLIDQQEQFNQNQKKLQLGKIALTCIPLFWYLWTIFNQIFDLFPQLSEGILSTALSTVFDVQIKFSQCLHFIGSSDFFSWDCFKIILFLQFFKSNIFSITQKISNYMRFHQIGNTINLKRINSERILHSITRIEELQQKIQEQRQLQIYLMNQLAKYSSNPEQNNENNQQQHYKMVKTN